MSTHGRRTAWISAFVGLICLVVSAYTLRGVAVEWWWMRKLSTWDDAAAREALERLGEMKSRKAIPRLTEIFQERDKAGSADKGELVPQLLRAAVRIGPEALSALVQSNAADDKATERMTRYLSESAELLAPELLQCAAGKDSRLFAVVVPALSQHAKKVSSELVSALESPSERIRLAAAVAISYERPRLVIVRGLLIASLKDPDPAVRLTALKTLRIGSGRDFFISCELNRFAAPTIVALLQDSENEIRLEAAWCLGFSSSEEAVPGLVDALDDPWKEVRGSALTAISNVGIRIDESRVRRALVPRLMAQLRGSDSDKSEMAARALLSFGNDAREAFRTLFEYWKGRPNCEREVARSARWLGAEAREALPMILKLLFKRFLDNRDVAIRALQEIGPPATDASPTLLAMLKDSNAHEYERRDAARALASVCAEGCDALDELLRLATDGSAASDVRRAALQALGQLRRSTPRIVRALLPLLEDTTEGPGIRSAVVLALGDLGPEAREALPVMEREIASSSLFPAREISSLWKIDPKFIPEAVKVFTDFLNLSSETQGMAGRLAEIGPAAAPAVPALIRHLKSGREGPYADSPAETLRRIGKPAVPALCAALRSDDVIVRSQAAEILGNIGPAAEAAMPALTAALDDEDDEVRRDAKKALEKVSTLLRFHDPPATVPADAPKLSPLLRNAQGEAIATREVWETHRGELRAKWLDLLGELPRDRGPVEAEVISTEEITKYTRRRVRYRIEDDVYTEGYLLTPWDLPADSSRRVPAVVVFHPTVETQAKQPAGIDPSRPGLHIGVQLAELGYVAFCPRCYIFDEGADYAGNVVKMKTHHPTWKGMTRMLLDAMRAADYLESLAYVDSKRIGCIGHSLGAKEVLYAAAFDERYRAAIFSEGGIGLAMSNWDAPWYLGPEIKTASFEREQHELLALIAPRAFLLLAGNESIGGADGARSWPFVEAALEVYKLLGADDRFGWIDHGFGHDYPRPARAAAEEFLVRWLQE